MDAKEVEWLKVNDIWVIDLNELKFAKIVHGYLNFIDVGQTNEVFGGKYSKSNDVI